MRVLYEDESIIAVHKPADLLVHRTDIARGQTTEFALQMVADLTGKYVYPIHRIDRPTSGVLLFAFSEDATRQLKEDFTEHRIEKTYHALVRGWITESSTLDHPLKKVIFDKRKLKRQKKSGTEPESQEALTHIRPIATGEVEIPVDRYPTSRYSLVELRPKTGRTHQLRRHMSHLRHPIIGDRRYGDRHHNRMFEERLAIRRMFLTALTLELTHPKTGKRIKIETAVDAELEEVIGRLNLQKVRNPK